MPEAVNDATDDRIVRAVARIKSVRLLHNACERYINLCGNEQEALVALSHHIETTHQLVKAGIKHV